MVVQAAHVAISKPPKWFHHFTKVGHGYDVAIMMTITRSIQPCQIWTVWLCNNVGSHRLDHQET